MDRYTLTVLELLNDEQIKQSDRIAALEKQNKELKERVEALEYAQAIAVLCKPNEAFIRAAKRRIEEAERE